MQVGVSKLGGHPGLVEPEHARLVGASLLPDSGEGSHRGWHVHHRESSATGQLFGKGRLLALDLQRGLAGAQAGSNASVDGRLGCVQGRQRLTPLVHVIELAPHHRRQQPTPAMGAEHADPSDAAARYGTAARDRHFIGEDARGRHHLPAIEKGQAAVELGDFPGARKLLVGWEAGTKGARNKRGVGPLPLRPDRPEFEPCRRAYRGTSARARQGLPDPLTSLSGATTRTAPVGGSFDRLASCVSPYLLAPSRNWWQGNGGVKE